MINSKNQTLIKIIKINYLRHYKSLSPNFDNKIIFLQIKLQVQNSLLNTTIVHNILSL